MGLGCNTSLKIGIGFICGECGNVVIGFTLFELLCGLTTHVSIQGKHNIPIKSSLQFNGKSIQ